MSAERALTKPPIITIRSVPGVMHATVIPLTVKTAMYEKAENGVLPR